MVFSVILLLFNITLLVSNENKILTELFDQFKLDYNKSYESITEHNIRREIFVKNLKVIESHNIAKNHSFEMTINQFADMTFEELYDLNYIADDDLPPLDQSMYNSPHFKYFFERDFANDAPDSFDWRDKIGAISSVKDQALCGSCYIFTVLDAIESKLFLKSGKKFEFSRQEILDCSTDHGTLGCSGGYLYSTISYINAKKKMSLEKDYPYQAKKSECRENIPKINMSLLSIGYFQEENEDILKKALYNEGPIVLSLNNLFESFFRYSNGIYYEPACNGHDDESQQTHAVLLVGYSSENGNDFWIVKNSYGKSWGEAGFMRIARNKNNHCNIASFNMFTCGE